MSPHFKIGLMICGRLFRATFWMTILSLFSAINVLIASMTVIKVGFKSINSDDLGQKVSMASFVANINSKISPILFNEFRTMSFVVVFALTMWWCRHRRRDLKEFSLETGKLTELIEHDRTFPSTSRNWLHFPCF